MRLQDFVRATKTEIKIGEWNTGKVPYANFPIRNKKALRLGSSFEWCIVRFTALDFECRVLVVLNVAKAKYEAIYGVDTDEGLRILCSYEYHPDVTPGWHCHASCDDLDKVPAATMRGPWVRRIPGVRRTHRRRDWGIETQNQALRTALERYRISQKGPLL